MALLGFRLEFPQPSCMRSGVTANREIRISFWCLEKGRLSEKDPHQAAFAKVSPGV